MLALFDRLEAAHRRAPAAAAAAGPAAAMGPPAAAGAGGLVASGGISGALAAVEGTALVTLADAFKYDGVLAKVRRVRGGAGGAVRYGAVCWVAWWCGRPCS